MPASSPIALVTGASRGLGRAMALRLAEQGHDLVITYRARAAAAAAVCGEIAARGRRAVALPLDAGDTAAIPAFVDALRAALAREWDRTAIDRLVNNAGIDDAAPFAATAEAQFDRLLAVHFKGVFFLTQALLPLLADGGRIVCVSTGLTRFAIPGYAAYASMKGAIEVLTRYLAAELGPRRIAVNVVAPGAVETDFTAAALARPGVREHLAASTALGRIGRPDDIGGVVAFLCSPDAGWITGQRLEASGGMLL